MLKQMLLLIGLSLAFPTLAWSDDAKTEGLEFFETRIRPLLAQHCYKCHSSESKSLKGGLLLDTREGIRRGGESGHAVVPHDVDESLLLSAVKYDSFEMPPSGPLDDQVVADFERWIRMGAPDPRDGPAVEDLVGTEIDVQSGRQFWSFQPPQAPVPPPVRDKDWVLNDIDRFTLARMEASGLTPVPEADRHTLIRRLSFDLTGLPPSLDEIDRFVNDTSDTAYQDLVDRLLQSRHFGERWGRHWLDVVRYAESMGKTRNFPFPFAWRYRDYVIRAFNEDKPYDQFITEQLAGDLLPADSDRQRDEQLIATGFLAIGSHDLNQRDAAAFAMEVVSEQIDVTSRGLMALTLGCARCHDHKFDPIPTDDYYAMAGIFRSTKLLNGYGNRKRGNNYQSEGQFHTLLAVEEAGDPVESAGDQAANNTNRQKRLLVQAVSTNKANDKQVAKARRQLQSVRESLKQLADNPDLTPRERRERAAALRQELQAKQKRFRALRAKVNKQAKRRRQPQRAEGPLAMGTADGPVADCPIHIRGDVKRRGPIVARGFLQVIQLDEAPAVPDDQSGRLQLAQWLTRPDHPLTSRVMVNRIWHHLFGTGIVRTVDNFGAAGAKPTHPELLDHLAVRFMRDGWSVKQLIRAVVLSRTYRLSGDFNEHHYQIDPDNQLLWRMKRRRLEVESIRDAVLFVSGSLKLEPPVGSVVQNLAIGELGRRQATPDTEGFAHRTVYLPIVRSRLPSFLTIFDFPEPSEVKGRRDVTTVPTQALFMLNNPTIIRHARLAAGRVIEMTTDERQRARHAYLMALGRDASEQQVERALDYVRKSMESSRNVRADASEMVAWTDMFHALFASAEFRYRN